MDLMKKIEDEKPEGWGLNKINAEEVDEDNLMEVYQ
jgi:hypothetical protein